MKHISVVIPNYNGLHLMQKNLEAVLKCLRDGDELVIVDDASRDESVNWLSEQFGARSRTLKLNGQKANAKIGSFTLGSKRIRVVIVMNGRNLRFAKSCNRGFLAAKHDLIFLLNNDVAPKSDVLKYLLPYFDNKDVFGVAPLEIEKNLGGIKAGKNVLEFKRGMFIHSRSTEFEAGETAWISGGSGLFDKQKLLKLGGFDLDYQPAYGEDIDLSFRARKMGWKVLFEPNARVDHNHESTNSTVFGKKRIERIGWKNTIKFVQKNANLWQKIQYYLWKPYWLWKMRYLK